jgi:protein disulfide-isomerase
VIYLGALMGRRFCRPCGTRVLRPGQGPGAKVANPAVGFQLRWLRRLGGERENPLPVRLDHATIDTAMKTFLSILMIPVLSSVAFAAKDGWLDDYEKAKAQAKAENKKILLDFTGSDWCGWCKKLDAEVFSQQEWKDYAAKHLVLVEVDFPKRTQLPEATKKQNEELAKEFGIRGSPTIVITSFSGAKKGELGYVEGGPEAFIKALKKAD